MTKRQEFIEFCWKLGLKPSQDLYESYLWAEKIVEDK
jgi:hypothetical protein